MHDDVYQMYLEEIKRIPPCTAKEEEMLLRLRGRDFWRGCFIMW